MNDKIKPTCQHHEHTHATIDVVFLDDIGRYQLDLKVECRLCGVRFKFIGLPYGLDLNGAAVSPDGLEARLSIAPEGEVLSAIDGVAGFTIRKVDK